MATVRRKNASTLPTASLGTGQARADEARPWERLPAESVQAFQAFRTYRDLGDARSLVEVARDLNKSYSLIRRWANRHNWEKRVLAWERHRARKDEAALREEREEALRSLLREADRLKRIGMAGIARLVIRDPLTGEASLDPAVTVRDCCRLVELALKILRSLPAPTGIT